MDIRERKTISPSHLDVEAVAVDGVHGVVTELLAEAEVERAEPRALLRERDERRVGGEVLAAAEVERHELRAPAREEGRGRGGAGRRGLRGGACAEPRGGGGGGGSSKRGRR